jgi:hypothetical protein
VPLLWFVVCDFADQPWLRETSWSTDSSCSNDVEEEKERLTIIHVKTADNGLLRDQEISEWNEVLG